MIVEVTQDYLYPEEIYLPHNAQAKEIAKLLYTTSFSKHNLEMIEKMGYKVKIVEK